MAAMARIEGMRGAWGDAERWLLPAVELGDGEAALALAGLYAAGVLGWPRKQVVETEAPGVEVAVETPMNLTKRQRELLEEFKAEAGDDTTSPQSHGFFDKVKELWDDLRE